MSTGTGWIKLYARNNILLKKLQIWDLGSFIFWSKFRFCGAAWGVFFLIFRRRSNMVADIFTQPSPPTIKLTYHITYLSTCYITRAAWPSFLIIFFSTYAPVILWNFKLLIRYLNDFTFNLYIRTFLTYYIGSVTLSVGKR